MATETIREFLVELGFKVDHSSLKKFETGITKATKAVEWFAVSIAGAVTAAAIELERFSSNLEQLYFASRRVGSSASDLRAFDQAARNFGTTAGEAQAAVEGLAEALNTSPGNMAMLGGLLQRVGATVSPDNVQNMQNLARVFQQMPMWQANLYAQHFGIGYDMTWAMRQPGFNAEDYRQQRLNSGITGAAAEAHQLQTQLRDVETRLAISGARLADAVMKQVVPALQKLGQWMDRADPKIIDQLIESFDKLVGIVNSDVKPAVEWLVTKFQALNKATDGWAGKLLAAGAALKVLGLTSLVTTPAKALLGPAGTATVAATAGAAGAGATAAGGGLLASLGTYVTALATRFAAIGALTAGVLGVRQMYKDDGGSFGAMLKDLWSNMFRFTAPTGAAADFDQQLLSGAGVRPGDLPTAVHPSSFIGLVKRDPDVLAREGLLTNMNVTIHIDGAQSPRATGDAVASSLQRIQRNALATAQ